jgi:hypothetical protein
MKIKDMKLVEKFMTPNLKSKSSGTTIDGLEADKKYYFALRKCPKSEKPKHWRKNARKMLLYHAAEDSQ